MAPAGTAQARREDAPLVKGPVSQSVDIAFRVIFCAVAALAVGWAASNWRQVPADSQAVILRFGRIMAVQGAGLAASWPRPAGDVVLVPGPERLLTTETASTAQRAGLEDLFTRASQQAVGDGTGSFLTGDGGVVLLQAAISYRVTDAAAFFLAQAHVEAALRRVFAASALGVASGRTLDDVMVTRPDGDPARGAAAEARRQALRGDLVAAMNARLAALAGSGAGLGVTVVRVDPQASLPPAAKIAFDGVLVAGQLAEQGVAAARTDAERTAQAGAREADRLLSAARATAAERVGEARTRAAPVLAIAAGLQPDSRDGVLDQLYRDGMAALLPKVGRLTTIDPADGARVIVPAAAGSAP
ncbi:MAG: SPFH domain-containing protein [Janthinobacterium lividum]